MLARNRSLVSCNVAWSRMLSFQRLARIEALRVCTERAANRDMRDCWVEGGAIDALRHQAAWASGILGGIAGAGVARGVALNATTPVFSAVLAVLVLKERLSTRAALGVGCSVLGTVLLVL